MFWLTIPRWLLRSLSHFSHRQVSDPRAHYLWLLSPWDHFFCWPSDFRELQCSKGVLWRDGSISTIGVMQLNQPRRCSVSEQFPCWHPSSSRRPGKSRFTAYKHRYLAPKLASLRALAKLFVVTNIQSHINHLLHVSQWHDMMYLNLSHPGCR